MTATDDSGADRTIPLNGPTLDCDRDTWLGTFPGLGEVRVEEDGTVTVDVDNADVLTAEERSNRERALRFGWGEPLSFARRGFWCAGGAAAVPPRSDGCVLLLGDPHEVGNVMLELAARGWAMMGDRVTPLEWQGDDLVAHPRAAPLLVSRRTAERAGVESHSVRANSDSRIVELLRVREPQNVAAIVLLRPRKPADARFTPLFGHERFAAAANLTVGGALSHRGPNDQSDPAAVTEEGTGSAATLGEHLRLAALPIARLCLDRATVTDDVNALVTWWQATVAATSEAPS